MDRQQAMAEIVRLIEEQNRITVSGRDEKLEIDSFTIILILTFADQKLGIDVDTTSLDFDDFSTLARIEQTVFGNGDAEEA